MISTRPVRWRSRISFKMRRTEAIRNLPIAKLRRDRKLPRLIAYNFRTKVRKRKPIVSAR